MVQSVVDIKNICRTPEGRITLTGPSHNMFVASSTEVPRGRWPNSPVIVQHSVGISIGMQFVKKDRSPVNISNTDAILNSFSSSPEETERLIRRLKKIGLFQMSKMCKQNKANNALLSESLASLVLRKAWRYEEL